MWLCVCVCVHMCVTCVCVLCVVCVCGLRVRTFIANYILEVVHSKVCDIVPQVCGRPLIPVILVVY